MKERMPRELEASVKAEARGCEGRGRGTGNEVTVDIVRKNDTKGIFLPFI